MIHLRRFASLASRLAPTLTLASALGACGGGSQTENPGKGSSSTSSSVGITLPIMLPSRSASGLSSGVSGTSDISGSNGSSGDAGASEADAGADAKSDVTAPKVAAVPLYSCLGNVYSVPLTIGGTQKFNMILDTGSTTMGVAGSTCDNCDVAPEYKGGTTATDEHTMAQSYYGSGEWTGDVYEDQVVVGSEPATPLHFVAITDQQQFFEPTVCNSPAPGLQGILGMGPPTSLLPDTEAYFDKLTQTWGVADVFATQLCDTGGTLWLGGYDPKATTGAPQYTSLLQSFAAGFYYSVDLESLKVNGKTIPVATPGFNDSAVDTGTAIFIMPTSSFNGVVAALGEDSTLDQVFGFGTGAAAQSAAANFFSNPFNCVTLTQTKAELDAMLPEMTLVFGTSPSIEVKAPATESYLSLYQGQWCGTLVAMDPSGGDPLAAIIGAPVLKSSVVIFDRANGQVGFAPHAPCP